MMNDVGIKGVALIGRQQNGVVLDYEKSVIITTDILKYPNDEESASITLDEQFKHITIKANDLLLEARDSARTPESSVYGESLVDLLQWIISVLKTHTHGPDTPPIDTFYNEANSRSSNMSSNLLNKRVKTR